jgi:hypothetical protein
LPQLSGTSILAHPHLVTILVEKIRVLVPQLFELNGGLQPGQKTVDLLVRAHPEETASVTFHAAPF